MVNKNFEQEKPDVVPDHRDLGTTFSNGYNPAITRSQAVARIADRTASQQTR